MTGSPPSLWENVGGKHSAAICVICEQSTMDEIAHSELTSLVPELINIARQAGEKIMDIYTQDFSISNKQDNSPLTSADIAANNTICNGLKAFMPVIPVLSEESSLVDFKERCRWRQYWLVDPLDGTREFIKRNDEFSVNIALIEGGQSILGVIHVPVTGDTYCASLNNGAEKYQVDSVVSPLFVRKTDARKITIVSSRSHGNEKLKRFIGQFDNPILLSMGSSLKCCLIAEGKADIYPRFGPTSEWDTAAAQIIVEEAGGSVVDTHYRRLEYNQKESLLNPSFFAIADKDFDWRQYNIL